jgi:hypothetical protein
LPDVPAITFDDFQKQLDKIAIMPWTVTKAYEQDNVRIELYDHQHGIEKFTIDTGLEFTIYLFKWLIPDDHILYIPVKRDASKVLKMSIN